MSPTPPLRIVKDAATPISSSSPPSFGSASNSVTLNWRIHSPDLAGKVHAFRREMGAMPTFASLLRQRVSQDLVSRTRVSSLESIVRFGCRLSSLAGTVESRADVIFARRQFIRSLAVLAMPPVRNQNNGEDITNRVIDRSDNISGSIGRLHRPTSRHRR